MTKSDYRVDAFRDRVMADAEVLTIWLIKQFGSDAGCIFFLCAMLQGLIRASGHKEAELPAEFRALLTALDATAVTLGPFVAALERDKETETVQ